MLKIALLSVLVLQISLTNTAESMRNDDGSIEVPIRRKSSNGDGFNIFQPNEDMIFNFVKKLVDTAHQSSKIALRRVQKDTDKRKSFKDEVGELVELVRESPRIPILDDMPKLFHNDQHTPTD